MSLHESLIASNSSPQRIAAYTQQQLKNTLLAQLKDINRYSFVAPLSRIVEAMTQRYLFNQGILEDLDKIQNYSKNSLSHDSYTFSDNIEQQMKNSCLILEDVGESLPDNKNLPQSFQNNLKMNESLVVQINIIYSREINRGEYPQSLQLFLKWAQVFQEHAYGGFLKPLYREFNSYIYRLDKSEFATIVDEVCVFVQFMVAVVTDIYGLKILASCQYGQLIKNQNVYNLIMGFLFKRTKIKQFALECIKANDGQKISLFEKQLFRFGKRPTSFFGIGKKFRLQEGTMTESEINKSLQIKQYVQPYAACLKLVNQLCKNGSPVTKLKTIVAISKQIVKQIQEYYTVQEKEFPQLDPDNLSSIIIYLLAKNGDKCVYEELKVVEYFTTTNCLNCISGYYLNCFIAAVQSILQLQD